MRKNTHTLNRTDFDTVVQKLQNYVNEGFVIQDKESDYQMLKLLMDNYELIFKINSDVIKEEVNTEIWPEVKKIINWMKKTNLISFRYV